MIGLWARAALVAGIVYSNFGAGFDPITTMTGAFAGFALRTGASASTAPPFFSTSMPADAKIVLSRSISAWTVGFHNLFCVTTTPVCGPKKALGTTSTVHPALLNTLRKLPLYETASGSCGRYTNVTDDGILDNSANRILTAVGENSRHATSFLMRSVASLAFAASFSSAPARSLASATSRLSVASLIFPETTIQYVAATPTNSDANKTQLAQYDINSAHARDISIPKNLLILGGIITLFLAIGVLGLIVAFIYGPRLPR